MPLENDDEVEKLLKILAQKSDKKLKYQDDIFNFIEFFGLKRGRFPVRFSLINAIYTKWSKEPETKRILRTRLNSYFNYDNLHIYVSKTALSLAKNIYEEKAEIKNSLQVFKQKQIHDFIHAYHLEKGKYFIEAPTLFNSFINWRELTGLTEYVMKYSSFLKIMKIYFPFIQTKSRKEYIGINKNLIREINEMKSRNGKRKKRNKKI